MLNYKDKSVCPEVVLGFSPPEVPALDLETNGVWTNKDWPAPVSLLQLRHTHNCLFVSPQTSHKVTFPQAYGSSFLQPACSQGAVVEWVCSEFLSLPHLWSQERQLWTLGWVKGRRYLFSSVPTQRHNWLTSWVPSASWLLLTTS